MSSREFTWHELRPTPRRKAEAVGIELEWEFGSMRTAARLFMDTYPEQKFWKITEDGSLREGIEFKSSATTEYREALTMLEKFINISGVRISHRCSVHVHLNYQSRTPDDVLNFLALYTVMEPVLDQISGQRSNNPYCIGIQEGFHQYTQIVECIANISKDAQLDVLIHQTGSRGWKYSSVNVLPLYQYGTVEIRTHEGTTDINRIIRWVDILNDMRNVSTGHKTKDFIEFIINTDPSELFGMVGLQVGDLEDYRKAVYRCRSLFQDYRRLEGHYKLVAKKINPRSQTKKPLAEEPTLWSDRDMRVDLSLDSTIEPVEPRPSAWINPLALSTRPTLGATTLSMEQYRSLSPQEQQQYMNTANQRAVQRRESLRHAQMYRNPVPTEDQEDEESF
jgi:hypothetical protein